MLKINKIYRISRIKADIVVQQKKKLKYWTDRIHTDLDVYDKKGCINFS